MNAVQIQEIVRETIRQELAAFFSMQPQVKPSGDYVSPAQEARIRLMARDDLRAMAIKKARGGGHAESV